MAARGVAVINVHHSFVRKNAHMDTSKITRDANCANVTVSKL